MFMNFACAVRSGDGPHAHRDTRATFSARNLLLSSGHHATSRARRRLFGGVARKLMRVPGSLANGKLRQRVRPLNIQVRPLNIQVRQRVRPGIRPHGREYIDASLLMIRAAPGGGRVIPPSWALRATELRQTTPSTYNPKPRPLATRRVAPTKHESQHRPFGVIRRETDTGPPHRRQH